MISLIPLALLLQKAIFLYKHTDYYKSILNRFIIVLSFLMLLQSAYSKTLKFHSRRFGRLGSQACGCHAGNSVNFQKI